MKHLTDIKEKFKTHLRNLMKGQRGVTGLETAIILIAFVVVASVFAFTVLSTGIFSSERGKETVFAGLKQAQGSVELKGSVIANGVVDRELSDADTAWTAMSSVTATRDATDKKEGSYSGELSVGGSKTGLLAYENVATVYDLSSHDSIEFWVKSSVDVAAGVLDLVIDQDDNCSTTEEEIDLPVLVANTWKLVEIGITDTTTRTSIDCVGFDADSALSTSAVTLNFDYIIVRGQATSIVITIANSVEGEPVDLSSPSDADGDGIADTTDRQQKMLVTYTDLNQLKNDLYWTKTFTGVTDGDDLLEVGERAEVTIYLEGLNQATPLIRNKEFTMEVKPSSGSVLSIQRTMPAKVDTVVNLQ